jgi:hypothetical protein
MKTKIYLSDKPHVGQHVTVYGQECEIIRVYSYGTIDVATLDGKKAWRITGLAFS